MRITYGQETNAELIRAAEQAYQEAAPQERGHYDRGRNRRHGVVTAAEQCAARQRGA